MCSIKLFVGNIPYICSKNDIKECFSQIDGYINFDIIFTQYNITKGYGFITINNPINAQHLKTRTDIKIKGRILRFIEYQNEKYTYIIIIYY